MKEQFLENEYAEYWIENDIIVQKYKISLRRIDAGIASIVADGLQSMLRLYNQPMPLLVEINNVCSMDRKAGKLFSGHSNMKELRAVGVLGNSPAVILGGKLYVALNKPKVKFDFFRDRNKAMEWLCNFKLK